MPANGSQYSGEGKLIEAVILGDPNKTVIPVVCDALGRLYVDAVISGGSGAIVQIEDTAGNPLTSIAGSLNVNVTDFPVIYPVSGTVTTLQGTSPWIVSGTVTTSPNVNVHDGSGNSIGSTSGSLNVDVTNTVPVTLTSTTITGNVTVVQPAGSNLHVDVDNFPATQPVSEVNIDKSFGTWAYYSGTSGTVNVTAGQRVTAITCHSTVGGTLTIAGGSTITIPANTSFADNPQGNITAPTIVFTNTDAYFIEVVS